MKRFIENSLIILLLLLCKLTVGQDPEPIAPQSPVDIVAMEYFFDSDPGYGNGTPVTIGAGSTLETTFDADLSGLTSGFHILYVRVKDANDNWSFVINEGFLKPAESLETAIPLVQPQITHMEYFFDSDPGFGNGTAVTVVAGGTIETDFNADLSGLIGGFHVLYVRVKDASDIWSLVHTEGFIKPPDALEAATPLDLPQITHMEYFFDTDPGFGNGIAVTVVAGSTIETDFNADLSGLTGGFHVLYVRVKDANDNWSLLHTEGFLKPPDALVAATPLDLPQVTHMEYFFDTDPGFGNGTDVAVAGEVDVNVAFDADLSALTPGFHILYVRVKDDLDNWSLIYSHKVYTFPTPEPIAPQTLPDIVAMEYFFNNDPGFGNGTEIINTPGSSISEDLIAGISALGKGNHVLYVRVKDENNMWSQSFIQRFCVKGLQVFLEGPYDTNTGLMSTALNDAGLLPHSQPFDSDPAAVWYYDGNETVTEIPNANVVDWLLLQARDADSPENATSAAVNETQVAFLLNDGEIVGLDGESLITFSEPIINDLYLVVFQRNHVGVMSAFPLDLAGECEYTYSFDASAARAHGDENGHKQISPGVWGMASGDGDADGQITLNDKVTVWQVETGSAGYLQSDFTMDGQTDNKDKDEQWVPNVGAGSFIPD